jgi:hypothetical protein
VNAESEHDRNRRMHAELLEEHRAILQARRQGVSVPAKQVRASFAAIRARYARRGDKV